MARSTPHSIGSFFTTILILFFVPVAAILIFAGYITLHRESAPRIFPMNDPQAMYVIFKSTEHRKDGDVTLYYVNYRGKNVMGSEGDVKSASVLVGASDVSLDEYLTPSMTQRVIIKGAFGYSSQQCIAHRCTKLSDMNRNVVVNIQQVIL